MLRRSWHFLTRSRIQDGRPERGNAPAFSEHPHGLVTHIPPPHTPWQLLSASRYSSSSPTARTGQCGQLRQPFGHGENSYLKIREEGREMIMRRSRNGKKNIENRRSGRASTGVRVHCDGADAVLLGRPHHTAGNFTCSDKGGDDMMQRTHSHTHQRKRRRERKWREREKGREKREAEERAGDLDWR
jgi:hypothetical protein